MKQRAWSPFLVPGVVGSFLLLLAPPTFAQGAATARGRVGLGVSISDVGELVGTLSDNTPTSVIAPTIFVPITITSRFRVEPEVGYYRSSSTNEITSTSPFASPSRTVMTTSVHVGTGAFGLTSRERFTLYYGARVAYLRTTQSSVTGSGPNSSTYPRYPGYLVAPAVGGEYFLSDYLSLGGEVQVRFTSSKATSDNQFAGSVSATTTSTHGAFVLRFYFPG